MAVCLTGAAAFAQWAEPTLPTEYATSITLGNKYQVRNASLDDQFIGAGQGYNVWTTAVTMVARDEAITYIIDDETDDYGTGIVFKNSTGGLYTFISGALTTDHYGWGEMHVDMASQGYNHFQLEEKGNGIIRIYSEDYPEVLDGDTVHYSGYWGTVPTDVTYPVAVWAMLDPDVETNLCDWQFIDMTQYLAQCDLYDALVQTLDYANIDQTVVDAATKVYEDASATPDELEAQVDLVMDAIKEAAFAGASEDNPVDMTNLIVNADFSTYDISGWDCTFVAGVSATNIGFQSGGPYTNTSYTYVNHDGDVVNPNCTNFIEAWTASALGENPAYSQCIGDAQLSQTLTNMQAGKYVLACDAIAVQQSDVNHTVTGVQLFATGGDLDSYSEIHTGNGIPEHVTLEFVSAGGDLVIGLRTVYTDANWIGADNFELTYYGEGGNAYLASLEAAIESWNAQFPDMSGVYANADLKDAYSEALATAEATAQAAASTDEEYTAVRDALNDAGSALNASVSEYEEVFGYIEYCNEVSDEADANGWEGLVDDIADYRDNLQSGYYDGSLTSDDIASISTDIHAIIISYISENAQAGDDISMAILNRGFDTDISGWELGGVRPSWGGYDTASYENNYGTGAKLADIGSGNVEVFETSAFDIYQTLPNMPAGLYTLTCQAFERDDAGDGMTTYLYAVADGEESSTLVWGITDQSSEDNLYNTAGGIGWPDDSTTTDDEGNVRYIPDSMYGANVYFYAGYYVNTLNVLLLNDGDLTIGLRDASADWVIFDNFGLVYQGNEAASYYELLQELIDEAEAILATGDISNEVASELDAAVDQGYTAMDGNSTEECQAAMQALQTAIADGNESHSLVTDLAELVEYVSEVSVGKVESSVTGNLLDVIEDIQDTLEGDGYETDAAVVAAGVDLKSTLTSVAMNDHTDATEDNPADISAVIILPDYIDAMGEYSYFGWDLNEGTGAATNYGAAEIYNQEAGAGMSQIIYNLAAGYYRLGVQGFYRPIGYYTSISASDVEEADTIHYVDIVAGETATRMLSIYVDAAAYSSQVAGSSSSSTYTIPASMEEASNGFAADLYQNVLQFEVEEDGTDVPVGVLKTGYVEYDWLIFANWTLEYLGTTEPAEDPTTAIESVEGSGDVLATTIYGVNGTKLSHLTKGVNIVKTTLSDGTVKVSKVLVK